MYKYGLKKGFKTKYSTDVDNTAKKSNYMKMYNLELETMNGNSILRLQNKIGNTATKQLLEQLSMTKIDSNAGQLIANKNKPYNKDTASIEELNNTVRNITDTQSNKANDIVKRTMLYDTNRQIGRQKLNSENIGFMLNKLDELSTILKIKSFDSDNKALDIKNADKLLDETEKLTVNDADYILNIIKNLQKYNEDEHTIKEYMEVLNLLSNTGVNINEFLQNNGYINIQKKLLYKALGADRASE